MTQGPIEPDLVEKVAKAMQDSNGLGGHFADETYMDDEDFKLVAKAAIAVALRDLRDRADTSSRVWAHLWIEGYARENGVNLNDK